MKSFCCKISFIISISIEGEKNGIPVEVAMVYNTSYSENLHSYVNNINTHEGGTHLSGFRRGLTHTLKKYADESGLLKNVNFLNRRYCIPWQLQQGFHFSPLP